MQGIFVCACAGLLLLFVLLSASVRVTAELRTRPSGGGGYLRADWLFFTVRLPVRLHLLRQPVMTLELLRQDGAVRTSVDLAGGGKRGKRNDTFLLKLLSTPEQIGVHIAVGVADSPMATALLCGALARAIDMARPLLPQGWGKALSVSAEPVFDADMLSLKLTGIIELSMAQIIKTAILGKRGG